MGKSWSGASQISDQANGGRRGVPVLARSCSSRSVCLEGFTGASPSQKRPSLLRTPLMCTSCVRSLENASAPDLWHSSAFRDPAHPLGQALGYFVVNTFDSYP